MPGPPSFPGIPIAEGPGGPSPVRGVPTSVAAFIGASPQGPEGVPVPVTGLAGFEAAFGGPAAGGPLQDAVRLFFRNGGTRAVVLRIGADGDARGALHALDGADPFNLLVLPDRSDDAVLAPALACATARRALLIIDPPAGLDGVAPAEAWIAGRPALRSPDAAAYLPRLLAPDPLDGGRPRAVAASGAVAGVIARTDATRGVWKAPAGTEAVLHGVSGLTVAFTDEENARLNRLGLNALRRFGGAAPVVWGARTLAGGDGAAAEWRYLPVRRMAAFLAESVREGTRWAAFEPNGEALWSLLRLGVGAFLDGLWRQGAFQGDSPREAYKARCDAATTTQADIARGVVNIVIGFAPLKPAEFVVLTVSQRTADAPP